MDVTLEECLEREVRMFPQQRRSKSKKYATVCLLCGEKFDSRRQVETHIEKTHRNLEKRRFKQVVKGRHWEYV